jgi:tRNA-dihydrouridine synthase
MPTLHKEYPCSSRPKPDIRNERAKTAMPHQLTFGLAPMEGVTDLPTRLWLAAAARPVTAITPFFRITRGYPLDRLPWSFCPDPLFADSSCLPPTRPQIMGSDPEELARCVAHLVLQCNHPQVDLNFGCPAPTVIGHNGGSGLIRNRTALWRFLDQLFSTLARLGAPAGAVTIKTRLGFDNPDEAHGLFEIWNQFPIGRITLHGRTRAQRYSGRADWRLMNEMARSSRLPITGSGDLVDLQSARAAAQHCPDIDQFLIGRGALRNPWIFASLALDQPIRITHQTLRKALISFLCLQNVFRTDPNDFARLLESGLSLRQQNHFTSFQTSIDNSQRPLSTWTESEEVWWSHFSTELLRWGFPHHKTITESEFLAQVTPIVLSRLKMVWNSLRTSLPSTFMDPALLRSQNAGAFFANLDRIVQSEREARKAEDTAFELTHQPQHDWIFSGERKGHDGTK